jgi:hypothetical protein
MHAMQQLDSTEAKEGKTERGCQPEPVVTQIINEASIGKRYITTGESRRQALDSSGQWAVGSGQRTLGSRFRGEIAAVVPFAYSHPQHHARSLVVVNGFMASRRK